ncbi:hypothetical protein [Pseudofulvimonas gallinarii]|uniref:hypothetical protein n=1 Tax=Pseudofulvimonas gallinarii TaxID=634155 RepID=UPI0013DE7731|nr:hypothetical protein [Pseudofulvimonas gallinarii]
MFSRIVEILPGETNEFVIPLAGEQDAETDADGLVQVAVVACSDQPRGCPHTDAQTGLRLVVPDGWSLTQPFFHETAAGTTASIASATLFRSGAEGIQVIELNPRHWPAVRGDCLDRGAHRSAMAKRPTRRWTRRLPCCWTRWDLASHRHPRRKNQLRDTRRPSRALALAATDPTATRFVPRRRESSDPDAQHWIPAFAGMTSRSRADEPPPSRG